MKDITDPAVAEDLRQFLISEGFSENEIDTGIKDAQGRPVVMSRGGAVAFARMMKDSKGQVKGSDVASSQRSVSKNRAVGGVPGSKHLKGNALDIHGTSKAWMKKHGAKYGWYINDYSGSHGGHFDFKRSGSTFRKYEKGGKVHGLTRAILGEKGPEFVLDADTTAALEQNFPGFLSALNRAKYDDAISVLKNYTSYEGENTSTIMIQRVIVEKPVPMPMGGGNASTSSIDSSMDSILQPLTVG
jgi:hypothetical protein